MKIKAENDPAQLSPEEQLALMQRMQHELRELKYRAELAETMNDTSIDRILAIDTQMRVIAWNKMCETITGIPRDKILGANLLDTFPELRESDAVTKAINMALKGLKSFLPSDKGSFHGSYSEQHFVPLRDSEGIITGVLIIIHDVAHRVKMEDELKSLNRSLAKKNKELNEKNQELLSFAHITGHDLKEPLRKIYTFAELILSKEMAALSETGRKHFRRIQASVQRMGLLVDDILTFSQISAEEMHPSEVNLDKVAKAAINNLKEFTAEKKAVIHCNEGMPVINGYRNALTKLFQNLIHNAIKFQQPGNTPELTIECVLVNGEHIQNPEAQTGTTYACISFTDNGIGFEEKYADRIFQMFQRLHTAEHYAGTGIGLSICRKIAMLHQGFITAESELGMGSRFTCYLPVE